MTALRSRPQVFSPTDAAIALALLATCAAPLAAQGEARPAPTMQELLERLDAQDRRIEELSHQQGGGGKGTGLFATYDKGFRLRSDDGPFELRVNGRMQFRYVGFDADRGGKTSSPEKYRNDFEIERARLEFAGTFLDKDTHFYINIDADTDDNHVAYFHDFWVNHKFNDAFDVYVGKAFVPGSREWLNGSTRAHLADRSLATTFFRPDRSIGVWVIGEPIEDVHYRVMIANGFNTTNLESAASSGNQIDTKFAYSGSLWWDPLAPFGKGFADLEQHEELAMRVGTSVTYAPEENGQQPANQEADAIRLSDGSKLTGMGADHFDLTLVAVDAAMKYQGLSVNGEAYFRSIDSINIPSMPTMRSAYDWGGYVDCGYMILPRELELVARFSTIQGDLKDSFEYAGGVNWYVDGTHKNKFSVDATKLDGSPTSNSSPNFRVGDDGWLFRIQWQIAF